MRGRLIGYGAIVVVSLLVGLIVGGGPGVLISGGADSDRPATVVDSPSSSTTDPDRDSTDEGSASATSTTSVAPSTTRRSGPDDGATSPASDPDEPGGSVVVPTTEVFVPLDLTIAVANASDQGGVARFHADLIEEDGFTEVFPMNADGPSDLTTVFHAPGLEAAARRVAAAAGRPETPISPWDERPGLQVDLDYDVLLLLGTDLEPLP